MNPFSELFAQTEAEHRLPPGLLTEVARQESNYNPTAVGPKTKYGTAKGLFQFIDPTAKEYGIIDPFDPVQSTKAAGRYLSTLYKKYNGDLTKTLAAYNWGPGNVDHKGLDKAPPETQKYIYDIAGKLGNAMVGSAQASELNPADADEIFGAPIEQKSTTAELAPEDADAIFGPVNDIFGADARKAYQVPGTADYVRAKNENVLAAEFQEPGRVQPVPLEASETSVDRFGMPMMATAAHLGQYASRALQQANPPAAVKDYLQQAQGDLDTISGSISADQQSLAPEGVDWARLGGEVATTAPLGGGRLVSGAALKAAPKIGALINNAVVGGLTGAALTDPNTQNSAEGAGIGAAAGALLPPALSAAGRVVGGTLRPAAQYLKEVGVKLTPGQMIGPTATRIEQGLTSIPILGDFIRGRQTDAAKSFNRAVTNNVLDPIGEKLPSNIGVGHESIAYTANAIGATYDKYLPTAVAKADAHFMADLKNLWFAAKTLPAEQQAQLKRTIQSELIDKTQGGNQLAGDLLKGADSELGRLAAGYRSSANFNDRELGSAFLGVQKALRASITRNSPKNVSEGISAANASWARFLRIQEAASRTTSKDGVFSPESFTSAVRKFDKSRNKGKFAKGEALMQNLADAGTDVLGRKVPDSGTPLRGILGLGLGGLAGHGVGISPEALAIGGATVLPYTQAGNALIRMALTTRPPGASHLGQGISALAPYLGPAGAPVGNMLLDYGN